MENHFFDTDRLAAFSNEKMKKINLFESARMFCDVYCLKPGQSQKPHTHEGNDKVYCVLTGECVAIIGDVKRTLRPGEVAVAPAGVIHGLRNDSEATATALVFMAPHPDAAAPGVD